jgi:hypothetical protein
VAVALVEMEHLAPHIQVIQASTLEVQAWLDKVIQGATATMVAVRDIQILVVKVQVLHTLEDQVAARDQEVLVDILIGYVVTEAKV